MRYPLVVDTIQIEEASGLFLMQLIIRVMNDTHDPAHRLTIHYCKHADHIAMLQGFVFLWIMKGPFIIVKWWNPSINSFINIFTQEDILP